jgi:hypothetical protein
MYENLGPVLALVGYRKNGMDCDTNSFAEVSFTSHVVPA